MMDWFKTTKRPCFGGRGAKSSLFPKIIETVIPKITYLWNLAIGGNFKELSDPG